MSLLSIFATAILPIVAIAAAGFVLGRRRDVAAGPLNTVTIYVLVPALVFHSLATTALSGETLASVAVGVFLFTGVMALLSEGSGRMLGETEPILGSFVLVSIFSNAGNYGIPVSEFAFGAVGRSTAVVFIVAQSVAMYTLGVYLAARGEGDDWYSGMRAIFEIPLIYVVIAALAARWLGAVPAADTATMETLKLVGDSSIPVMLLILGIELAETDYSAAALRVTPAVTLKMLVAPLIAVGIAALVGFQNTTVARVFVLECSMPAAVTTLILTGEFAGSTPEGIEATEYAGTAIFVSTVLSVPLLTGLIALLQSGVVL
ncbi:MAG: AEC family transporter [Haloarculaceae archaeon]